MPENQTSSERRGRKRDLYCKPRYRVQVALLVASRSLSYAEIGRVVEKTRESIRSDANEIESLLTGEPSASRLESAFQPSEVSALRAMRSAANVLLGE